MTSSSKQAGKSYQEPDGVWYEFPFADDELWTRIRRNDPTVTGLIMYVFDKCEAREWGHAIGHNTHLRVIVIEGCRRLKKSIH